MFPTNLAVLGGGCPLLPPDAALWPGFWAGILVRFQCCGVSVTYIYTQLGHIHVAAWCNCMDANWTRPYYISLRKTQQFVEWRDKSFLLSRGAWGVVLLLAMFFQSHLPKLEWFHRNPICILISGSEVGRLNSLRLPDARDLSGKMAAKSPQKLCRRMCTHVIWILYRLILCKYSSVQYDCRNCPYVISKWQCMIFMIAIYSII